MRLGISSYAYTWACGVPGAVPDEPVTALGVLQRAADLGVDVVQLADNVAPQDFGPVLVSELRAQSAELGIEIEVGTRGIAPEHLGRCADIAAELGASVLRIVVDDAGEHPSPRDVINSLAPQLGGFGARGLVLAIENHDRFSSAELVHIVRTLDSPHVGICLDTVNSFGALEGPGVTVEALAPYAVNLHVKDFRISRAWHSMGFVIEGAPAGTGDLDIPWLLERLAAEGRDCSAILEMWTPPQSDIHATIALEHEWAATSIAYLRTLIPPVNEP